ncbi:MAG: hypothetical protein PWP54_425 [Thermosipho sp. (in: thermotogales)]|nr:hypothetical protein [Thermosipho sp. (in: thermotogales)]MDN5324639.1 hypothetical protein [Thermosipho sp. (in: thermotogales)]
MIKLKGGNHLLELTFEEKIFLNFLLQFIKSFDYSIHFNENEDLIVKSHSIDVISLKKIPIDSLNLNYKIFSNNTPLKLQEIETLNLEDAKIVFENLPQNYKNKVKFFFKDLSNEKSIEENEFGEVLLKKDIPKIYFSGFLVATEPNFLFSYNIKEPSKSIIEKLNKFELPFKRTTYVNKIKKILLTCENAEVAIYLADDLKKLINGQSHDEINWKDVQIHAIKLLNGLNKVLFFTEKEEKIYSKIIEFAKSKGYKLILVSETLRKHLDNERDILGNKINTVNRFYDEYSKSFQFDFVDLKNLNDDELKNLELVQKLLTLLNLNMKIMVSNNMIQSFDDKNNSSSFIIENQIIFKRSILKDQNLLLSEFLLALSKAKHPDDKPLESVLKTSSELILKLTDVKTYKSSVKQKESVLGKLFKKFK